MIAEYLQAAMKRAHYEMIEDSEPFYGEIPTARAFGLPAFHSRIAGSTCWKLWKDG